MRRLTALLLLSLAGCEAGPATTCIVGDTAARAQGYVPVELAQAHLDAQRMQFGLGTAAIGDWESLGDAIATDGRLWLRSTRPDSPRYFAPVSNRYFQASSFVYVPPGVAPETTLSLEAGSVAALWARLGELHPRGVMVAGYVRFSSLRLIAIARAPIKAVPIAGNAQHYYTHPMQTAHDAWAYVVGIAARATGRRSPLLARALPPDAAKRDGYLHALLLATQPTDDEVSLLPASVRQVGEVVKDSAIAGGHLSLYPLERPAACTPGST